MTQVDTIANAPIAIDVWHHHIHSGRAFVYGVRHTAVTNDAVADLLIRVPASYGAHVNFEIAVGGDAWIDFSRVGSYSGGTVLAGHNRNFFSSNVASMTFVGSATIEVNTDTIYTGIMPGGQRRQASGGQHGDFNEIVLNEGDYLMRVTNKSGSAADIGISVHWYEPTK